MTKKIVFSTFGSLGDLHPYLAIALELQARGHRVTIATSEMYRTKIQTLGIGFHAMRPDLPNPETAPEIVARVMDLKTGGEYLIRELLMPHLRDSLEDLLAAAHDADVFVSHPVTFAAPLAAQWLQRKRPEMQWISTVLAPISLPSIYDPPTPPIYPAIAHIYKLGLPAIRAWFWTMRAVSDKWLASYYALRDELGLPARGNPLLGGDLAPERVLALFSSVLAAPQKDWPAQTRVCGFPFFDARGTLQPFAQNSLLASGDEKSGALSPPLEAFLASGEAPVVFTLGSSAVMDAGTFYYESAEAIRRLRRRAILLAGSQTNVPDDLPPTVAAFDYAPYSALFPRCMAIVHQGGVGTTAQALRSGKPQLIMPYSHDQPDHAARIKRMGVGVSVPRANYNAATASGALQKILGNAAMAARASQIGAIVQSENGAARAADEIETMLK